MSDAAPKRKIPKPRAMVLFSLEAGSPRLRFATAPPAEESQPTRGMPLHVPPADRAVPTAVHKVAHALAAGGFAVSVVNIEDDIDRLLSAVAVERPDVVFNMTSELEGTILHSHLVPACLELLGIACTGGDALCINSCLDRVRSRLVLRDAGVSVPRFASVRDVNAVPETEGFRLPTIVTQAFDDLYETEGAHNPVYDWDVLVERVAKLATEFDLPFLIEEYIGYRRLHVVVLGNRTLECLPIAETELPHVPTTPPEPEPAEELENEIGDSEESEVAAEPEPAAPAEGAAEPEPAPEPTPLELDLIYLAQLDENAADRVRLLARKAFRAMGCRDYAMIDIHLDEQGEPNVVDVRSLFDLGPGHLFALAAAATDRGYDGTVAEIARIACRRAGMPETALLSEQIEEAAPVTNPAPAANVDDPPPSEAAASDEDRAGQEAASDDSSPANHDDDDGDGEAAGPPGNDAS